jgi:hypothetical protein
MSWWGLLDGHVCARSGISLYLCPECGLAPDIRMEIRSMGVSIDRLALKLM